MSPPICSKLSLVEAWHDGRLARADAASVERHLSMCNECKKLAADLRLLRELGRRGPPALSPLNQQRRRVALLQDAARQGSASRDRRRPLLAALVVASLSLILLAIGAFGRAAPLVARSTHLALPIPERPRETSVEASVGAVFARELKGDVDDVYLERGALDISVRPLRGPERFLVRTTDAEVEVRGTKFRVEAEAGRIQGVFVQEGHVEVRAAGSTSFVDPGGEWHPPARPLPSYGEESAGAPSGRPTGTTITSPSAPTAIVRSGSRGSDLAAPPPKSALGSNDPSASFRDAVRSMEQGDYGTAADRLDRFAREHPSDARAEDVAFLAVLALERAGRREEAARAARRYLERFPRGFRRSEAEVIAASQK